MTFNKLLLEICHFIANFSFQIFFFRDEPEVNISEIGVSEEYATEAKNELRSSANAILNKTEDDPKFNYSKVIKLLKLLMKLLLVFITGEDKALFYKCND